MNFLIDKIDLFCSKIRIFRTWTFPRADGIQEVGGNMQHLMDLLALNG
jgi:hypothetical protein